MPQKPMLLKYPTGVVPQPLTCCPEVETTQNEGECCPPPPSNGIYQHPIPVTPVDPCVDAKSVKICGVVDPIPVDPVCNPLSIPYETCDGTTAVATGTTCDLIQVVPHPDAVMKVKICDAVTDRELVKMCDPVTGAEVLIQYDVTTVPPTILAATNLSTNTPYTGNLDDLVKCGTVEVEQEVYCDNGTTFIRWYVIDAQGKPTGAYWDTTIEGQPYTVTNPSGITKGECKECECIQSISDATGDNLSTLLPGTTFSFTKPECCVVKVTTDIGSFTIRKGVTQFVTQEFKCPFSVTAVEIVSGTCTLDEVHIISNSSINTCCSC